MRNIVIDLQNFDAWKIQLTIAINFISSKDSEKERVMHSNSGNIKFTPYSDANYVIEKLFKSLRSKYEDNLETSMKGSGFIFDSVQLMYYKCYEVNFKRGGSYIDSPDWTKKKKATINCRKVRDHCHYTGKYRGAGHSICNLKFNVPNDIPVVFHSFSHERQFECLGENTEKYKIFSVPMQKEVTKIDKDRNESVVTISYKIKFINSARFMATSLSNLVDNLAEGIHKIKCEDCDCFLELKVSRKI